jgi:hypothetical protein
MISAKMQSFKMTRRFLLSSLLLAGLLGDSTPKAIAAAEGLRLLAASTQRVTFIRPRCWQMEQCW